MGDIVFIVTGTKQNWAPEFLSYDYESMIGPPIFFLSTYGWLQSQTELYSPIFSTPGLVNNLTVVPRSVEGCR